MKSKRFTAIAIVFALIFCVLAGWGGFTVFSRNVALAPVPPAIWQEFSALFTAAEKFDPPTPLGIPLKMMNLQDDSVDWARFEGRVTLVNFWALWCPPCLKELPSLQALQKARQNADFAVAYISMDYPEDAAQLTEVMKFRGVPAVDTLYINDLSSWEALKLKALPTTLILDRKGRVAYRFLGDIDWTGPEASRFLDAVTAR